MGKNVGKRVAACFSAPAPPRSVLQVIDSTSVWTISIHLIQIGFSYDNAISTSLNKFNQNCTDGKYKRHRPVDINLEAIFVVLD